MAITSGREKTKLLNPILLFLLFRQINDLKLFFKMFSDQKISALQQQIAGSLLNVQSQ